MTHQDGAIAPHELINLLEVELTRAFVSVFAAQTASYAASEEHCCAFETARNTLDQANDLDWREANALAIAQSWLELVGHRIRCEEHLLIGGLTALRLRAAERLSLSPQETLEWDIALLLKVYANTPLREEWRFDTLRFRSRGGSAEFCPTDEILREFTRKPDEKTTVQ